MMKPPKILLNLIAIGFNSCSLTLFKPVPVLRLANNKVFQLGVLKPDRVVGLDPSQDVQGQERLNPSLEMSCSYIPCFERHGFVVNRVQEEVMDDFLHKENPSHIRLTSESNRKMCNPLEIIPVHLDVAGL